MMPTSYPAVLEFLYGLQRHGIKLGLETTQALLERTGGPHRRFRCVHVGGTNGKGSTAAMVASILESAGYRVGLYTSPHLIDFRERIQVNQVPIAEEAVVEWTERLRDAAGLTLSPTFFEFTTVMAFHHFADQAVDVGVLEVGMGGRFDATNVISPVVTGITNVALDHEQYLGDSLESIAFEKAGIIKPSTPLVVGKVEPAPQQVLRQMAQARQARWHQLGSEFHYQGEDPTCFAYRGLGRAYADLACPLDGEHQMENAACALAMVELLSETGLPVPETAIRLGLGRVRWEGRLETVETHPRLLLDGAHNPAAGAVLGQFLGRYRAAHPACRVILIIGMMRDKDRGRFLRTLVPLADEVILTEPTLARAASVQELADALPPRDAPAHLIPVPAEAVAQARRLAAADDVICLAGSLMLVGEVKALLRGCGLSPIRG